MKNYRVTVNGIPYDVVVEEIGEATYTAPAAPVAPAAPAAPAAAPKAPAAAPKGSAGATYFI